MVEREINRRLASEAAGTPWRWRWFLGCQLAAAVLLGSKFVPPFDALWQRLDLAVFETTNASLASGHAWQLLWAITNHRAFDAAAGGFFLLIFAWFIFQGRGRERCQRLAAGAFAFAWTVLVLDFSSDWVFNFRHPSPTLVVADAVRLSELVPHIKIKDSSGASFPGDHGTALIMFTATIGFFAGRRLGMLAAAGAVLFALPRLMSGAHWLSDIAVGSASVALVALALAFATPLHAIAVRLIAVPVTKVAESLTALRMRFRRQREEENV